MYYIALSRITQCRVESTSSPHSIDLRWPEPPYPGRGYLVPWCRLLRRPGCYGPSTTWVENSRLVSGDFLKITGSIYIIQVSVFIRIHEYEHHLMIWGLIVTLVAIFLSTKTWREPTVHGDSHQNMLISSPKLETSIHCTACWGTYIRNHRHIWLSVTVTQQRRDKMICFENLRHLHQLH